MLHVFLTSGLCPVVFKEQSYPTETSRGWCLLLLVGRSGLSLMSALILYRLIWRSRASWYARMSFWSHSGRKNASVTFFYSKNSYSSARPGRQRLATTHISTSSHLRYTQTPDALRSTSIAISAYEQNCRHMMQLTPTFVLQHVYSSFQQTFPLSSSWHFTSCHAHWNTFRAPTLRVSADTQIWPFHPQTWPHCLFFPLCNRPQI